MLGGGAPTCSRRRIVAEAGSPNHLVDRQKGMVRSHNNNGGGKGKGGEKRKSLSCLTRAKGGRQHLLLQLSMRGGGPLGGGGRKKEKRKTPSPSSNCRGGENLYGGFIKKKGARSRIKSKGGVDLAGAEKLNRNGRGDGCLSWRRGGKVVAACGGEDKKLI